MSKITKFALLVTTASFVLTCTAHAAAKNSSRVLQYVPADTPYVLASTKPLPTALANKIEPTINEMLQVYQQILRYSLEANLAELPEYDRDDEELEKVHRVVDEIIGLMSLDGLRSVGIERDSAFVVYGNGLMPVLRFELSDSKLFDAAIAQFEKTAGSSLTDGEADGKAYKYAEMEGARFLVATSYGQVVMTIVPSTFDDSQVALALGFDKPRKSLRQSKALRSIRREYGFTETFTGFVDNARIAETLTGKASGLDKDLLAAIGGGIPEMSDTCSSEVMAMVGIAPRIVFGYSELSTDEIDSSVIVELREDIAAGLTAVTTAIPGLGEDPGGMFSFGMGLNLLELRNFATERLDAMEADPYECEKFVGLQGSVAKGRAALNRPIPPVFYSFRGFVANIIDMEGVDFSTGNAPLSVDASLLIAIKNAEALLSMAALINPQIAELNLQPDGKPVKLELEAITRYAEEAFAAMSSDAVAVAVGSGAESKSAETLAADSLDPAPFIAASVDSERYYAMIADAMAQSAVLEVAHDESGEPSADEMPLKIRQALREVLRLSGSLYERMSVDVFFTERGIEVNGRATLSD